MTMQIENVKTGYILYPQIQLLETQTSQLGTSKAFTLYEPRSFDGDVTIRYRFLEGKNAGYAGMANSYREYLEERHAFPETAVDDTPFLLEIINSIYMIRNVAGISYTAEEVVTSFETAGEILSWFTKNDCTNLQVKLNGANKNGLFVQTPGKFYTSGKAGGNDALRDFQDLCRNGQIPCYLSVMFPFYYADHLFDGYSSSSMTAREINNKEAEIYYKEKSSLEIRTDLPALQVVSPTLYTRFASQYVQGQAALGEGVSVGEFTRIINSDFAVNRYCSRSQSRVNIEESLHQLSTCYQLTGENANVYTWRYLRLNEKVPTGSTGYSCMDRDIPFLQMVMHGRLAYTVPCFNSQADDREALLKAIETGSGLYFRLAETVDKDVMGTQNSFLYNVVFDLWKDIAVSHNTYVRTALDGLASVAMIDHTYLTDTLVCVTYENGVKLYINYAEKDVEADGLTVPGLSYIRV